MENPAPQVERVPCGWTEVGDFCLERSAMKVPGVEKSGVSHRWTYNSLRLQFLNGHDLGWTDGIFEDGKNEEKGFFLWPTDCFED